jgi:predicted permease
MSFNSLFYNKTLSLQETGIGFLFLFFCVPYGFLWWKLARRLKPQLHSGFRYAVFGLWTGWTFTFYGMILFYLCEKIHFLKEGELYALGIGYVMSIYLIFLTGMVLVWGLIRMIWKSFQKTPPIRGKD